VSQWLCTETCWHIQNNIGIFTEIAGTGVHKSVSPP